MKNIHVILKTRSRLFYNDANQPCYQSYKLYKNDRKWMYRNRKKYNIYITSDEEINKQTEPCWCVNTIQNTWNDDLIYYQGEEPQCHYVGFKKIIFTTDKDLIADGVQSIDNEFLEWFVKNPSCEWIEVKKGCKIDCTRFILNGVNSICCGDKEYKIILPKEEPKQKNSTLNIDILKSKVDNALANETQESLTEWLESQRNKQEPIT